ncbi:protein FAR1-RELATED SEQUENCE 9-like [Olea europaea var. sylvestris]|uniref:protein FAR1-RELATED SEQUENCE 9-like n=1 Tax=Olea europaea var. sylvestris TaxID=158386 RepID=UPI000C1D5DCA|nr:protein FAR1-RELATED SEQUENCE 9-like [Olea europaea var. sylvestris]
MNAFSDGYVRSKTSLKLFVEQYERALRSKVEKEFQADFRSFLQMIPCATKYEMEKQFQEIYTISKFKEFQKEFTEKVYCEVLSVKELCGDSEVRGIVCKHAVSVLIRNEVSVLPEKYILRRRRRDMSRPYTRVVTTYDGLVSTHEQLRYEQLCAALTKIADLVAINEDRSKQLMEWVEL